MRSNLSFLNVYEKKTKNSKVVTQLLYGDIFKILKKKGSWIKIKNNQDNYRGYIKKNNFPSNLKSTHKVSVLCSNLYSAPDLKKKINKKLSFGSKIRIINNKKKFYKFDNMWIKKKDLKKINYKTNNPFDGIKKFLNVKYKWGGKHFTGIDCSALVQLFLNYNNKFCPRDTKDQIKYFKKKINLNNIKKNDLIFWKGHVAIALSKNKLIHAYGPLKKVIQMPIKKTIVKIKKTANLEVEAIKRLHNYL